MSMHTFLTPRLVKMLDCDLKPIEVILVECPFWLASTITQGMVWPDQQFFDQFRKVTEEITAQPLYDCYDITADKCNINSEILALGQTGNQTDQGQLNGGSEPFPGYSESYLPTGLAQEENASYNAKGDEAEQMSFNKPDLMISNGTLGRVEHFSQYGDFTYPVNVMPAIDPIHCNSPYPPPVMQHNDYKIADSVNSHYDYMMTPEIHQEINPPQHCMYPPFILPFHHPPPQFVNHVINQLYPSLHGNCSSPARENAHPAQNIPFKDSVQSQHLMPTINNFSVAHQLRDFRFGSIDCDTFLIENRKSGVSGYASASFRECALSHPFGNITKTKRAVHCHFVLDSGVQCYLTITPSKIKFSSKQTGISYLIDEAGVRTCIESFTSLKKVTEEMWRRNAFLTKGPKNLINLKGNGLPRGSKGKITWHAIAGNQPIIIDKNDVKFVADSHLLGDIRFQLPDFFLHSSLARCNVKKARGRVFLKAFENCSYNQSITFNGDSLEIKFHTQKAKLNVYGHLELH